MDKPTYKELQEKVDKLEERLKKLELNQIWSVYSQSPIPTLIVSKKGGKTTCRLLYI